MLACICGGFLEILFLISSIGFTTFVSYFGTSWYNARQYKKYVEFKEKHKNCHCECHKND